MTSSSVHISSVHYISGIMIRVVLLLIVGLLSMTSLHAQSVQLSNWGTLSSLRTTIDADVDASNTVWVATSGGVYAYKPDGTTDEYRNIGALQTLDATAVFCDRERNEVYVGGENGALDIHMGDGQWLNVTDIVRASQYPKRGIRDLVSYNGVLYIAADFGVVTFDLQRRLFIETIDRIGTLQEKTGVNGISILRDSIWIATDSGVAVAPLQVSTLRLPSVWKVLGTADGLPDNTTSFITHASGMISIAVGPSILTWNGTAFDLVVTQAKPIRGLSSTNDVLYSSTDEGVYDGTGKLPIPWSNTLLGHTSALMNGSTSLIGYALDKGIEIWNGTSIVSANINSPTSNQFARLSIDTKGALWVATDVDPPRTGQGLSVLVDNVWNNITALTHPVLTSNACYRVSCLSNGSAMIGTWGGGAYKATASGSSIELEKYSSSNSAFQGIASDDNYVLASDAVLDRSGNVWMVNEQSASTLLVRIAPDGQTTGFGNCIDARNNLYRVLAVDGASNKWVGSTNGNGLLAYNERGTADRADDICNVIRTSNSQLPDNVVTALRIDRTGALWVGTAKGVAVISGPSAVSNTAIPFVRRITALTTVVVNDIHVDALNYKWIATTSGVYVLNEDGTAVLAVITKGNSQLLDDNIRSVTVDDQTGKAYFGTSSGCSVAQTSSIAPSESFDLAVRPQPFRLGTDAEVIIDGLAADADVKIMTVGGFMVAAFQARGRQASWDGRDIQGNRVPPGVYIIQSSSSTISTSAVAKIVVK